MDGEEEILLGTFTYDIAEKPTQTFPLQVWEVCVGKMPGQKRTFASKSICRRRVDGLSRGRAPILAEGDMAGLEDWAKQPSAKAEKAEQDPY